MIELQLRVDGVREGRHALHAIASRQISFSHRALRKWKATIYEANMPPEAIIKALQERVARQRMLKEKFEGELEAIVQAETERAFANLDEDKRSLLIRILTRMMKIKQHGADSASSLALNLIWS